MHDALSRRPRAVTVAEFLDWPGDRSGRRFQLVNGELRPISPGSPTHGTIQSALGRLIGNTLAAAGSPCRVVCDPGVITAIHPQINMRVPDLGITCTPDTAGHRALPDPLALVEILSPSNATDTWDNVWAYTTVASVREIVVVHSVRVLAELLRRGADGRWPAQPDAIGANGTLRLESIDFACPLRAAYAQTHLA
ncbi:MAG: Uma2 family endonuclease [Hyphomicrobiaceae bacterium]